MDNNRSPLACCRQIVCHISAAIDSLNFIITDNMALTINSFGLPNFNSDITFWCTIKVVRSKKTTRYRNRSVILSSNINIKSKLTSKGHTSAT